MAAGKKHGPLAAIAAAFAGVVALVCGGERMAAKLPFLGRLWRTESTAQKWVAPLAGTISREEKLAPGAEQARKAIPFTDGNLSGVPKVIPRSPGAASVSSEASAAKGMVATRLFQLRRESTKLGSDIAHLQSRLPPGTYHKLYTAWKQHDDALKQPSNFEAEVKTQEDEQQRLEQEVAQLKSVYG